MIKKLLFTAALLVPGLAYAGTPSATLPGQIAPAGSDPGVPAPAAAAGFTTVAINDDFSQPFWANKANWLDCNDGITSPPASPLYYRSWVGFGFPAAPCSAVLQETDQLTGLPALHMYWKQAFYNVSLGNESNMLQTVNGTGGGGATGRLIPPNAYFEVTARLVSSAATDVHWNIWSYTANGSVNFEWDALETWVDNGDTTSCATLGGCTTSNPANAGFTPISGYHRYGWRNTSDGTTASWWCFYIDDSKKGCANPSGSSLIAGLYQQTLQILLEQGCRGPSEPPGCGDGSQADVWISRIRVFSCAGINSSAKCFSSSPNP